MSNADIEVVQQIVENEVNFEGETQIVVVQERIIQVVEVVSGFVPSDEYVRKSGDTMTGDLEVNTQITEAGNRVVSVKEGTRTLYVEKTGNDSNDGLTPATAFLTRQKGLNVAAIQYSTEQTDLFVGVGDWDDDAVMPGIAYGTIRVVGADTSDPTQTVFLGGLSTPAISTGIDHRNNSADLIVEGVEMKDHFFSIYCENTKLTMKGIKWTNCSYAYRDDGGTQASIVPGDYATQYDGWTIGNNFAFTVGRGGKLSLSTHIVANNMDRMWSVSPGGSFNLSSGGSWNVTHKASPTFGPFTVFTDGEVSVSLQGDTTTDGVDNPVSDDGAWIYSSDGRPASVRFIGGYTHTISNLKRRFGSSTQGTFSVSDSDSVTFIETNVPSGPQINIGSVAFDTESIITKAGAEYSAQGFDSRIVISPFNDDIKTADYEYIVTDRRVQFDTSAMSLTADLPSAPITGQTHAAIVETGGNDLIMDGNGNNIHGSTTYTISTVGSTTFMYNGTQWVLVT